MRQLTPDISSMLKIETSVINTGFRWYFHDDSDFPLAQHYKAAIAGGP